MPSFDIPVNIKVSCDTEEQAQEIVSQALRPIISGPALTRKIQEWDFILFVSEEDEEEEDGVSSYL